MSANEPAAAAAASDLTRALNRMSGRLEEVRQDSEERDLLLKERDDRLASYGRKNRVLIVVTIVSLVLDIALTVALAVVAAQAHTASARAVSAQQEGAAVTQRICETFGKLAALKPPAGNPDTNPSRGYLQRLHATLDELGTDLGCPAK